MKAPKIKRHEFAATRADEVIIDNPSFAQEVTKDVDAVAKYLSEIIGPIDAKDIHVDKHGKVTIHNHVMHLVQEISKVSPLDNILCNHHLICAL